MRKITFTPDAFKEYNELAITDFEIIQKIIALIRAIQQDPFKGIGKPEPLKGEFSGYWSRRINHKDRLVYKITDDQILIIKYHNHY